MDRRVGEIHGDPNIVSREGREAITAFHDLFFGDLGTLDLEGADATLDRIAKAGANLSLSGAEYADRIKDEIQFLLGWRPKSDAPAKWIGYEPGNVPATSAGIRATNAVRRAMMSSLARSIPRFEPLHRVEGYLAFAKKRGIPLRADEEFTRVVRSSIGKTEYQRDPIAFIQFAKEAGVEIDRVSLGYAIQGGVSYQFDTVRGIGARELESADVLLRYAEENEIPVDMSQDKVFEGHLLRDTALKLTHRDFDGAQSVFDFCRRHAISINEKSRNTTLSNSIGEILVRAAHDARNALDLPRVESVLKFCKRNALAPAVSEDLAGRWRTQIPDLVARQNAR